MHSEVAARVRKRLSLLWLPYAGTLLLVIVYIALGYFFSQDSLFSEAGPGLNIIKAVFLGVAVLIFPILRILDRTFFAEEALKRKFPYPDLDLAIRYFSTANLILWILAEVPAILGLVLVLMGAELKNLLLLCGISFLYLALLMPATSRIQDRLDIILP